MRDEGCGMSDQEKTRSATGGARQRRRSQDMQKLDLTRDIEQSVLQ
jgi:hypothetical protein